MIGRTRSAAALTKEPSGRSAKDAVGALSPHERDGWRFAPEGAAVHLENRVAVIADLHLGYEWARGACGDCLPAHSLAESVAKLESLLTRASIDRLIVAGDLVESPQPCARTARDLQRLEAWLKTRGVALVALEGNHDPHTGACAETAEVSGWTIAHGHRPVAAPRTITGHHHPVLRAGGHTAPCFLHGPGAIILPAFSTNAAGLDVASRAVPKLWIQQQLCCLVCASGDWLDFGLLSQLGRRMGRG